MVSRFSARFLGPLLLFALFLLGDSRPASAAISCFQDLRTCYVGASNGQDFLDIWAKGLDCELAFVDCTRRALIGR